MRGKTDDFQNHFDDENDGKHVVCFFEHGSSGLVHWVLFHGHEKSVGENAKGYNHFEKRISHDFLQNFLDFHPPRRATETMGCSQIRFENFGILCGKSDVFLPKGHQLEPEVADKTQN